MFAVFAAMGRTLVPAIGLTAIDASCGVRELGPILQVDKEGAARHEWCHAFSQQALDGGHLRCLAGIPARRMARKLFEA